MVLNQTLGLNDMQLLPLLSLTSVYANSAIEALVAVTCLQQLETVSLAHLLCDRDGYAGSWECVHVTAALDLGGMWCSGCAYSLYFSSDNTNTGYIQRLRELRHAADWLRAAGLLSVRAGGLDVVHARAASDRDRHCVPASSLIVVAPLRGVRPGENRLGAGFSGCAGANVRVLWRLLPGLRASGGRPLARRPVHPVREARIPGKPATGLAPSLQGEARSAGRAGCSRGARGLSCVGVCDLVMTALTQRCVSASRRKTRLCSGRNAKLFECVPWSQDFRDQTNVRRRPEMSRNKQIFGCVPYSNTANFPKNIHLETRNATRKPSVSLDGRCDDGFACVRLNPPPQPPAAPQLYCMPNGERACDRAHSRSAPLLL